MTIVGPIKFFQFSQAVNIGLHRNSVEPPKIPVLAR